MQLLFGQSTSKASMLISLHHLNICKFSAFDNGFKKMFESLVLVLIRYASRPGKGLT